MALTAKCADELAARENERVITVLNDNKNSKSEELLMD